MAEMDLMTDLFPQKQHTTDSPEHPRRSRIKKSASTKAAKPVNVSQRDLDIMDTNNSSIVSKRSVEKLYYAGEPEYFRHFVPKFKRRSPLINRGYWLRMKAIEYTVRRFLDIETTKRKLVVNLGCGYDPLPFMLLGKSPEMCKNAVFVDVDYPPLMKHKVAVIADTPSLRDLLPRYDCSQPRDGLLASSEPYMALGCDLNDAKQLNSVLAAHLSIKDLETMILFIAEVSIAYMEREESQAVLQYAAQFDDVRFCLLEQHLPAGKDHPFAQTMLAHFNKLKTPLPAIGTLDQMRQRFVDAGWSREGLDLRTLWDLWSDSNFLTDHQRRNLDKIEPFDEWEEFALFGSHYFLMVSEKSSSGREAVESLPGLQANDNAQNKDLVSVPSPIQGDSIHTEVLGGQHTPRRFAASIPAPMPNDSVGFLGGMGTQERLRDCDTYSDSDSHSLIMWPDLRSGIQCHTVTKIGKTDDCLVVGGRTSPDKASADCWLRAQGKWQRARSLPQGRYRHNAIAIQIPLPTGPHDSVLVFGGKDSSGNVLDNWLVWFDAGWRTLHASGDLPRGRFGASMITDFDQYHSGILTGGLNDSGRIINDLWRWTLTEELSFRCCNITSQAIAVMKHNSDILGRFGAQMIHRSDGPILIGGICASRALTIDEEIFNMTSYQTHPVKGKRPLFVGGSVANIVDDQILFVGGGATCFSFGTYWNEPYILAPLSKNAVCTKWKMLRPMTSEQPPRPDVDSIDTSSSHLLKPASVLRRTLNSEHLFESYLKEGKPVVFTGNNIGPCVTKWDASYLKKAIGEDRGVIVHAPTTSRMDFQSKNFAYVTKPFGEFLDAVENDGRFYLRSLAKDAPSEKPAKLTEDYGEIANDFRLPTEMRFVEDHLHSSPLRVSGPVTMWLHYDVMANVLCQVRGSKQVLLYPPSDVGTLGFQDGASSSSINVFDPGERDAAHLLDSHPYEAKLEPGDILLIPPMWMHAVRPTTGMSVSVNVFFRNLDQKLYAAGRDVYGNRDLAAYERGRKEIERIVRSFHELPADISGFYLERLGRELMDEAKRISRNAAH